MLGMKNGGSMSKQSQHGTTDDGICADVAAEEALGHTVV